MPPAVLGLACLVFVPALFTTPDASRALSRFGPLLDNRRDFGVLAALVAFTHAAHVMGWYFAFSPVPPADALLSANAAWDRWLGREALGLLRGTPFRDFRYIALGVGAILLLSGPEAPAARLGR